jgi:hypothetical protein
MLEAGDSREAARVFGRVALVEPSSPEALRGLASARAAITESERRNDERLHEAQRALEKGDLQVARTALEAVIAEGGDRDHAARLLDRLDARGGRLDRVETPLTEAAPSPIARVSAVSWSRRAFAAAATIVLVVLGAGVFSSWDRLLFGLTRPPSPRSDQAAAWPAPPTGGERALAEARRLLDAGDAAAALSPWTAWAAGSRLSLRTPAPPAGAAGAARRAFGRATGGASMSCPACGGSLPGGQERCPACGAHVAPLTEGALAPDPAARPRPEPLREIPGLKKRERTWKDEVRERVRDRKRNRGDGDLPLFRDGEDADAEPEGEAVGDEPVANEPPVVTSRRPLAFTDAPPRALGPPFGCAEEDDPADLPLRPAELRWARPSLGHARRRSAPGRGQRARVRPRPDAGASDGCARRRLVARRGAGGRCPSRRTAGYSGERARAAALDLALLTVLWAVVVYFASRAAT